MMMMMSQIAEETVKMIRLVRVKECNSDSSSRLGDVRQFVEEIVKMMRLLPRERVQCADE